MKKRYLGMVIGLIVVIIFLVLPWIFMLHDNIAINKNREDYEIIEADIVKVRVGKGDAAYATIGYIYNGQFCQTEVMYYDREDQGKNSIQIAINKKTGRVYRIGWLFSYGDISKIFVIVCLVLLIFAKIYDDKKEIN